MTAAEKKLRKELKDCANHLDLMGNFALGVYMRDPRDVVLSMANKAMEAAAEYTKTATARVPKGGTK